MIFRTHVAAVNLYNLSQILFEGHSFILAHNLLSPIPIHSKKEHSGRFFIFWGKNVNLRFPSSSEIKYGQVEWRIMLWGEI